MKLILSQPSGSRSFDDAKQQITREMDRSGESLCRSDILVLPEGIWAGNEAARYEDAIRGWASSLRCHVVGGSFLERVGDDLQNRGIVVDGDGCTVARYAKRCAYGGGSVPASEPSLGEFEAAGLRVSVLICADFWFSDLILGARSLAHLIVVPACSVSRKSTPEYSRAMWRHMTVSRAYEFGAFVGISDWANDAALGARRASGVAGLADPTQTEPNRLFDPLAQHVQRRFSLDPEKLMSFRTDRASRQFFWGDVPQMLGET